MKKTVIILFLILSVFSLQAKTMAELQKMYNKANSMIHKKDFMKAFKTIANNYPENYYGQLSMLAIAKTYFLERNYKQTAEYLLKITDRKITEKEYWLAKTYLKQKNYKDAIVAAQNFIFRANDYEKIENSFFIIAEAYFEQKFYQKALKTLKSLRDSKYINNHIPLLHYKIGMCYEMTKDLEKANQHYTKLQKEYPYNEYGYLAETRLLNLKKSLTQSNPVAEIQTSDTPAENSAAQTFLQVGAFSTRKNASKLTRKLKNLGLKTIIFHEKNNKFYKVAVGPLSPAELTKSTRILKQENIDYFKIKRKL